MMNKKKLWLSVLIAIIVIAAIIMMITKKEPVSVVEPTAAPTVTITPSTEPTAEPTIEPTVEPTETVAPTATAMPTVEPTAEPTATSTPVPTATATPEPTATSTPVPTATCTPTPTSTPTPSPTATPKPTNTPTPTPTKRPTPTPSPTPVSAEEPYILGLYTANYGGVPLTEDTVTMNSLNMTCYYVHNFIPEGYNSRVINVLEIEDESIVTSDCDEGESYKFTPQNVGSTTATISLYTYKNYVKGELLDSYTFTIVVQQFESDVIFEEGDFIPSENGYPYLIGEWEAGENCTVQIWSERETEKANSHVNEDGAVAIVSGTGAMWTEDEVKEVHKTYLPWAKYYCVEKAYIREGVTETYGLSFDNLTEVSYPSTLKVVGKYCFERCNLTEVVLPEGVERIEDSAYDSIPSLTKIILPSTLKHIGYSIFGMDQCNGEDCENQIKEVTIPKSVEYIDEAPFYGRCGIKIILEDKSKAKNFNKWWDYVN